MSARRIGAFCSLIVLLSFSALGFARQYRAPNYRMIGTQARNLERSASQLERTLRRYSRRLAQEARRLAESASQLNRNSGGRPRFRDLQDDFEGVREDFYGLREGIHRNLDFPRGDSGDRWYYEVLTRWVETVERFNRLDDQFGNSNEFAPQRPGRGGIHTAKIRCKSKDFKPESCSVDGRIVDVSLRKQKSRAACRKGTSFGFQGSHLWVKNGCDGEFDVTYRER